ncbi:MAG: M20/M25/M40 family metallo-hydrolase [Pirellulaceae bacterium]
MDDAFRRCPIPTSKTGNLIIDLPGTIDGPRRMLMCHLDTVPICRGTIPKVRGGEIYSANPNTGLGADNRAGVAVVLSTALTLLRERVPHPPITLLFTVQEEIGLQGARAINPALLGEPALAFNWDGGDPFKVTVGAIGGYRMNVQIRGIASHAGVAPERGVSAIAIAGLAIAKLHQGKWLGKIKKRDFIGTSNIGVIQGGNATNVVTDSVHIRAEVRSHQLATIKELAQRFEAEFQAAAANVTNNEGISGKVEVNGNLEYEPFALTTEDPSWQAVNRVMEQLGHSPQVAIANGGLDANWMFRHGIPTVSLGCGQRNQHMTSERLVLDEYYQACEIALRLATLRE